MQSFGQIPEQGRRDREIEGLHNILTHNARQIRPPTFAARVNRYIFQLIKKGVQPLLILRFFSAKFGHSLGDHVAVPLRVQLGPRGTNDP